MLRKRTFFFWRPSGIDPQPTVYSLQPSAFTLLEVILAMGVVTMLILMMANMFREVSVSWNIGMQSAEMNTAGRAGVDFIARELSQAVASPIEAANPIAHVIKFELLNNGNELKFVTLAGDVQNGRVLRGALFRYKSGENILQYWRETSFNPYTDDPSWCGGQMLITNVTDFQVTAYSNESDLVSMNTPGDYDSSDAANSDRLPVCVDIYLEVLGNDDFKKASTLSGADLIAFKNRNARRYTTRVYFNNRQGWAAR